MAEPFGWPPGAFTGIGSLPGTDPAEAIRLVLGEVTELPYLPELPARGVGADMIGRAAAALVDLPVEYLVHGWTLASHPGRDLGRAKDHLERDLDQLTELGQGLPRLKLQLAGPLTMAASLELPNLHKVLTDRGAMRDLAGSLAEGARQLVAQVELRLPGCAVVLQLDEPALPAVLSGRVPTPSGYGTVRALPGPQAVPLLAQVLDAVPPGRRVVHCCAPGLDWSVLREAGADAISIDASLITDGQLDAVGELVDGGGSLWLGVVPGTDAELDQASVRQQVRTLWRKLGFEPSELARSVVLTPACGLAGASSGYVRRSMAVLRDASRASLDEA
ncbi:MAG TPA: methionine synthase [Jatrophihabitans sp.]|nr:methionine synthase [Jatrophihabitans sp.]